MGTDKIYIKDKNTHEIVQTISGRIYKILIYPDPSESFMKLIYKDGNTLKYICMSLSDHVYISIDEND